MRREIKSLGADLDVNHRFASMRGRTLLGICAAMGRLSCAKELLNAWRRAPTAELHKTKHLIPQCHMQDTDGFTALMLGCQDGHEAAARAVMQQGADVNAAKQNGATVLMLACQNGHEETARLKESRWAEIERWLPAAGMGAAARPAE